MSAIEGTHDDVELVNDESDGLGSSQVKTLHLALPLIAFCTSGEGRVNSQPHYLIRAFARILNAQTWA
jgi:hypothetical protein